VLCSQAVTPLFLLMQVPQAYDRHLEKQHLEEPAAVHFGLHDQRGA